MASNPATVTVLYPATVAGKFNLEYYRTVHMPFMADEFKAYGLKGYTVTRFLAEPTEDDPTAPPAYAVQSVLEFETIDQVKAAFHFAGPKVKAALSNVCAIQPQIIVGETIATRIHREVVDLDSEVGCEDPQIGGQAVVPTEGVSKTIEIGA